MWNLALDGNGQPLLPGTNSCGEGCRGVVQINSDGSYSVNQECASISAVAMMRQGHYYSNTTKFLLVYSMAQASKAILPKDAGGPWGQRIGVSVGGSMSWGLVVGAYVTGRVNPTDWLRYCTRRTQLVSYITHRTLAVVRLNRRADNTNGVWNPQTVETTIEFRGMQVRFTDPHRFACV